MTGNVDPYVVLGVPRGAACDLTRSAHRKKAEQPHRDLNQDGSVDDFVHAQEAYQWFQEQHGHANSARPERDTSTEKEQSADDNFDDSDSSTTDPIEIVREFMVARELEVRFDGEFVRTDRAQMAHTREDIDRVLGQVHYDGDALTDELMMHIRVRKIKLSRGMTEAAIRIIQRGDQNTRLVNIMKPLLNPLSALEQEKAHEQWHRFVSTVFDIPPELGIAVLKKFIYQVKSKRLNRPIKRHLMPIFQGLVQGSGKTTAALKFLTPLKELRSEPALLSDFADKRSGDVYRYPVIFIDDMDQINPDQVPTLNSLVTGNGLLRRKMGGSGSAKIKQLSTLIGTCNKPISELVPDETGNRRFVTMPFRNGEVERGGGAEIWQVINETDFDLLWRSVDVFQEDPTDEVLGNLFAWQDKFRRLSPVEGWISSLDIGSPEVMSITGLHGIKAGKLYNLFVSQVGHGMSETAFGLEMGRLILQQKGPFGPKKRFDSGFHYPYRSTCSTAA